MENHNLSWVNLLFLWPFFLFFWLNMDPVVFFFASHGQICSSGWGSVCSKEERGQSGGGVQDTSEVGAAKDVTWWCG